MSIIKDLKNKNGDYTIINSTAEDCLNDLSKINIFVGANNSGKSRFMRSLYINIPLVFLPSNKQFETFLKQRDVIERQRYAHLNAILTEIKNIEFVVESKTPCPKFINHYNDYMDNENNRGVILPNGVEYNDIKFFKNFHEIDINDNLFKYDFYRIYIPSLRGLIPLIPSEFKSDEQSNDVYAERIRKDYFPDEGNIIIDVYDFLKKDDEDESESKVLPIGEVIGKSKYFSKHSIITGLQFYEYVKNYLLGDLEQREMIREYERFLSKEFFNKEVVLIPKVKDDVLTIKIGDEERPVYDLGEGIQSIILITLPLFLYLDSSKEDNTNVLVFIEEPEIGLHPTLQRKLIEILLDERFDNFQFFFTTHSNHFLDRQFENEDVSIYLFDKNSNSDDGSFFSIEKVDFNYPFKELGALPSAVLYSNCIILVEGSLDVECYRFYLDLYQEHLESTSNNLFFKENIHYSFLRGGGDEADKFVKENKYLYERLLYIRDADDKRKKQKKKNNYDKWGFKNYYFLKVRELENLIPKNVLINILEGEEKIKTKIKKDFNIDDYKKSDFYKFIAENILGCNKDKLKELVCDRSTMKTKLARKQKYYIEKYDDLTDEAKDIAKKMHEFISKMNE